MKSKNHRNAEIAKSKRNSNYDSIRDEIIRAGGAFSVVRPLNAQETKWLISKGFDPTARVIILSQLILPRICSIIGRGLTMEEIGLLTSTTPTELKTVLRKSNVKNTTNIKTGKVDKTRYIKITVPLRRTKTIDGKQVEMPLREPILVPRHLVEEIRKTGYVTEDGRLWRYDYVSLVSGPLPTVYMFRSIKNVGEESLKKKIGEEGVEELANDQVVVKTGMEIGDALTRTIEPMIDHEQFLDYMDKVADFFLVTYANAMRYAWRYRALNDYETYEKIEELVWPWYLIADGIKKNNPTDADIEQ